MSQNYFYPPTAGENLSVGVNGAPIPPDSTLIGAEDPGGNLAPLQVDGSGNLKVTGAFTPGANTNGANVNEVITTAGGTRNPPANTVGFILMNISSSTDNIRWNAGGTVSTSAGQRLEPGRDTGYIPMAAPLNIAAETGSAEINIQWVLSV